MYQYLYTGNPENQATACDKFRLLKQEYESALREEALSEIGDAGTLQQTIRYGAEAIAVSALARDCLITHYRGCPRCETSRA